MMFLLAISGLNLFAAELPVGFVPDPAQTIQDGNFARMIGSYQGKPSAVLQVYEDTRAMFVQAGVANRWDGAKAVCDQFPPQGRWHLPDSRHFSNPIPYIQPLYKDVEISFVEDGNPTKLYAAWIGSGLGDSQAEKATEEDKFRETTKIAVHVMRYDQKRPNLISGGANIIGRLQDVVKDFGKMLPQDKNYLEPWTKGQGWMPVFCMTGDIIW